jgi:predicted DsbA family dithiol-disulfide isomerase
MRTKLWLMFTVSVSAGLGQSCPPLAQEQIGQLTEYVRQKYKLPSAPELSTTDIAFVDRTCFRRIRFHAADLEPNKFSLVLFLSPDTRFLTRELLDTSIDPREAEERKRKALNESLARSLAPSWGPDNAAVTIDMFSDFQCPYCRSAARLLRQDISAQELGVKIRFHFLPLPNHDWASAAAETAACAARQSDRAFWSLHDFVFQNQQRLRKDNLETEIKQFADSTDVIDANALAVCVRKKDGAHMVDADLALARENEIDSTPTLFFNGFRVKGLSSVEQVKSLIRETGVISTSAKVSR